MAAVSTELVHQRNKLVYPDIIFNRPISGLSRLQIGLFGGKTGHLEVLSECYATVVALGLSPACLVQANVPTELLPVGTMLLTTHKKTGQVEQTSDVLSYVERANAVIMAPDVELGSALQILGEKVFATATPLILTDELIGIYEFLPAAKRQRANTLLFLSNEALVRLAGILDLGLAIRPDRGIYNTISVVDAISNALGAHVVAYSSDQVVVSDVSTPHKRGVIHLNAPLSSYRGLMLGLLAGLLADVTQDFMQVLEKVLTAGYLYNRILPTDQIKRDSLLVSKLTRDTLQRELQ